MTRSSAEDDEELAPLLTAIRRFVTEKCRPLESKIAAEDEVPAALVAEMAALGLFGLSTPVEYGGLGLSMHAECAIVMELGRASPAIRSVVGTNIGIGSQGLIRFGSPAQKARFLPGIAAGSLITAFALTEAEAGSDAAALQTRAERVGEDYRLNGVKRYITNADRADLFTVLARTDPNIKGARGISAFLVSRDSPGLSVGPPEKKMGQHGAHICDVVFEDVPVAAAARLGAEGQGFRIAMTVLDRGRLHIAALCVGVAERLIADALAYTRERRQFGQRLADLQLVQAMLADSQAETYAARTMVTDAARRYDSGAPMGWRASAAKLFASEMVGRVADCTVQMFGGAGYIEAYGIERLYRDVRIFRIYEGASEIQKLVIAREMLKDSAATRGE